MSTIVIITPPSNPPKPKSFVLASLQDHLKNAATNHPGYKVYVQSTGFIDRMKGLARSSTAWFNGLIAAASGALLFVPELLIAAQGQLSNLGPALDAKTMAIAGFVLGVISIILRARTVHSKK